MKSQVWRSHAMKRALRRRWMPSPGLRPGVERSAVEGAKYLLIANGATLVASIGGVGEAWHAPELRPVFAILVSQFIWGFAASVMAWICFTGADLRVTHARRIVGTNLPQEPRASSSIATQDLHQLGKLK